MESEENIVLDEEMVDNMENEVLIEDKCIPINLNNETDGQSYSNGTISNQIKTDSLVNKKMTGNTDNTSIIIDTCNPEILESNEETNEQSSSNVSIDDKVDADSLLNKEIIERYVILESNAETSEQGSLNVPSSDNIVADSLLKNEIVENESFNVENESFNVEKYSILESSAKIVERSDSNTPINNQLEKVSLLNSLRNVVDDNLGNSDHLDNITVNDQSNNNICNDQIDDTDDKDQLVNIIINDQLDNTIGVDQKHLSHDCIDKDPLNTTTVNDQLANTVNNDQLGNTIDDDQTDNTIENKYVADFSESNNKLSCFEIKREIDEEKHSKQELFACPLCKKQFKAASSRYTHVKKAHNVAIEFGPVHCLEKGCSYSCAYTSVLQRHLTREHRIEMKYSNHQFNSFEDFETWKETYEKQEMCRFVKRSGCRVMKGSDVTGYLYCSRTGQFVSHAKGKKKMRKVGSSKISGHCTASIKFRMDNDGVINVKLCSTHYGHDKDYRYLRLTKGEKVDILKKVKSGIPRDIVVDTVRLSCTEKQLDQIHLIDRKMIDNITRSHRVSVAPTKGRKVMSVNNIDKWVEGIHQSGDDNPILYYKKKDTRDTILHNEDECIILMTSGQSEICSKLANNGIMYATVLLLPHLGNFYLTTLLVVDEFHSTFPISFMICNRHDNTVMELYFREISVKKGPIKVCAFVTDNLKYIFDSWCKIMGPVENHIWANRYVDEEWRDYLSVITSEKLQISVYDQVYKFIECGDDICKSEIPDVIDKIYSDPETSIFGQYLKDYFSDNVEMWATCYIKDTIGLSQPINFDLSYNKIKNAFEMWNLKQMKYLSKSAQQLIKLVVDFQLERNSKICSVINEINKTHELNSKEDIQNVFPYEENVFKVAMPGTSTNVMNPETIVVSKCNFANECILTCGKCNLCYHSMKCSCKYYQLNSVCNHLHLVAMVLESKQKRETRQSSFTNAMANECLSDEANQTRVTTRKQSRNMNNVTDIDSMTIVSNNANRMWQVNTMGSEKLITEDGNEGICENSEQLGRIQIKSKPHPPLPKLKLSLKPRVEYKSKLKKKSKFLAKRKKQRNQSNVISSVVSKINRSKEIISQFEEPESLTKIRKLVNKFYNELVDISENQNNENATSALSDDNSVRKYPIRNRSLSVRRKEIVRMEDNVATYAKANTIKKENTHEKTATNHKHKKQFIGWEGSSSENIFPEMPDDFIVSILDCSAPNEVDGNQRVNSNDNLNKRLSRNEISSKNIALNSGRSNIPLRTYSKRKIRLENDGYVPNNSTNNFASVNGISNSEEGNLNSNKIFIARSYLSPKRCKMQQ